MTDRNEQFAKFIAERRNGSKSKDSERTITMQQWREIIPTSSTSSSIRVIPGNSKTETWVKQQQDICDHEVCMVPDQVSDSTMSELTQVPLAVQSQQVSMDVQAPPAMQSQQSQQAPPAMQSQQSQQAPPAMQSQQVSLEVQVPLAVQSQQSQQVPLAVQSQQVSLEVQVPLAVQSQQSQQVPLAVQSQQSQQSLQVPLAVQSQQVPLAIPESRLSQEVNKPTTLEIQSVLGTTQSVSTASIPQYVQDQVMKILESIELLDENVQLTSEEIDVPPSLCSMISSPSDNRYTIYSDSGMLRITSTKGSDDIDISEVLTIIGDIRPQGDRFILTNSRVEFINDVCEVNLICSGTSRISVYDHGIRISILECKSDKDTISILKIPFCNSFHVDKGSLELDQIIFSMTSTIGLYKLDNYPMSQLRYYYPLSCYFKFHSTLNSQHFCATIYRDEDTKELIVHLRQNSRGPIVLNILPDPKAIGVIKTTKSIVDVNQQWIPGNTIMNNLGSSCESLILLDFQSSCYKLSLGYGDQVVHYL